jgi:hypothetical protein
LRAGVTVEPARSVLGEVSGVFMVSSSGYGGLSWCRF